MTPRTVVFYDGVCGLCDRLVRFLLARDRRARLRFAPLQGDVAQRMLARHGVNAADLDTVYVVADWHSPRERLLSRSGAVLHAIGELGGIWGAAVRVLALVPLPLADLVYGGVSKIRYRVFGHFDACPLPPRHWRDRFLDTCD